MAKVAGAAFATINGARISLKSDPTVRSGQAERKSVDGLDGRHGTKETPMSDEIEFTITKKADTDVIALGKLENATVLIEMIDGTTAVLRNCDQLNRLEHNVTEGEITLLFAGPKVEYF